MPLGQLHAGQLRFHVSSIDTIMDMNNRCRDYFREKFDERVYL